ncbi:MAG: DUF2332 domain-containing protein [Propionibacteriaceae bacterium]
MALFDSGATLADRFRNHARDNTHLYGYAMRGMADDWEAGGPVRQVCAGYEDVPDGSALQLRLLAGVFRLVLTGQAPELEPFYPSLGGTSPPADAWSVMRQVIGDHVGELRTALETAPQTNEVGRSAALLAGLFDVVAASGCHRIRLLELGASAGLNLLVDAYGYSGDGWRWGSESSPVQLVDSIQGHVHPQSFTVTERRGCDLHPVDVATEEGRVLLTSFVWPFNVARHRRLAAALEVVAAGEAPTVDAAPASRWLAEQLDADRGDATQTLTVVWQSITQLYWPADEISQVRATLAEQGAGRPLAHVAMEFDPQAPRDAKPRVTTELWQPQVSHYPRQRLIATAHDHGVPVRLVSEG